MPRTVSLAYILLLLFAAGAGLAPSRAQQNSATVKSFHDDALDMTYFYPGSYVPLPPKSVAAPATACSKPVLIANSDAASGTSSFMISAIDGTCPDLLKRAQEPGPFVREQVLLQFKSYGDPAISQEPTNYTIADHQASIVLAAVPIPVKPGKPTRNLYAAKACVLGSVLPKKRRKSKPAEPVSHVLCFDFTTENQGMLSQMYSFILEFGDGPLQPVFPGSVIRNLDRH